MNGWQIWAIVLACACACLFVATGLALQLMYRYKAQNERLHYKNGGLIIANADLDLELGKLAEQYGKDAIAQTKRVDAALRERDEATRLLNGLQSRFDTLGSEIKQSRTRRKPLARTE